MMLYVPLTEYTEICGGGGDIDALCTTSLGVQYMGVHRV